MNSRIYVGQVRHRRLSPVRHAFAYPVYFYGFDLDELPGLDRRTLLFGYNRIRPVAIHDRDYLYPGDESLRQKVNRALAEGGIPQEAGRIILVTAARYLHYVFNPISFFYAFSKDEQLLAVLAQVNNTFGEMHLYLLVPDHPPQSDASTLRFETPKVFHVSPFFPRRGEYRFELCLPGDKLDNAIFYRLDGEPVLEARLTGVGRPLTPRILALTLLRYPVHAALTMPRILFEAARLYFQRRLPVYEKPVPDHALTLRAAPATPFDRLGQKMAEQFFSRLPEGELRLRNPDGSRRTFGTPGASPSFTFNIKEFRFYRRVMISGDIGFGEAYTDGDWDTDDLPGLLRLLSANEAVMNDRSILTSAIGRIVNYLRHLARPNSIRGSARNIEAHYDLSNRFFATFLDTTMTYSSARYLSGEETLEEAQRAKLHLVIDKARLGPEDHVLEIGCGWGSFAIEAVRRSGCRVTGITLSRQQLELGRKRVREAGLEERIDLQLRDYRHVEGRFTKVVSIEMLEAVGHAGLAPFFAACDRALLPGGRAVIQVITIPDRKYTTYRYSADWIRKHIFPGGHLPSLGVLARSTGKASALLIDDVEHFGHDYGRTLGTWRRTLLEKRQDIYAQGFDEKFLRTWDYYFAYCQAGFEARIIDLAQLVLVKPDTAGQ